VNGVAPKDFARAVREDIKVAKLLYLGTEHGIYISFDDGANWQSLRQNLPDTPVHDIAVEQRDLVIGTHGRGFYIMDNIAPLRQGGLRPRPPLTSRRTSCVGLGSIRRDYRSRPAGHDGFARGQGKVIRTAPHARRRQRTPAPAETTTASGVRRNRIRRSRPACSGSRGTCDIRAPPISRG
jgi:hypothetical protein